MRSACLPRSPPASGHGDFSSGKHARSRPARPVPALSFEYAGRTDSIDPDIQPCTEGYRVTFNLVIGAAARGTLHVDLAVGAGMNDDVVTREPATALSLPRLTSNPYRLYPVVDQIADKICATMTEYRDTVCRRARDQRGPLAVVSSSEEFEHAPAGFRCPDSSWPWIRTRRTEDNGAPTQSSEP